MAFPASMTFPACPSCYSGVGSVTLEDSRPDATTTGLRCRYVHWFPEYARGLVALGMTANSHGGASTRLGGGQFTVAMADGSERPIWFCSQDVSPGLPCAPDVDLVADGYDPYTAGGPGRITFELLLDTGTSDPAAMQAIADSIVAVHYAGDYTALLALDPDVNEPTCPYDPGRGF